MKQSFNFKMILFTIIALLSIGNTSFAIPPKDGAITGEAVETDIAAFIDNWPIESFNVSDYTYVIAEQLADYGFDVTWDPEKWSLFINRNKEKEFGWMDVLKINRPKTDIKAGRKAYDIYNTTIKTYLGGEEIKAYNINGQTIVCMEDLVLYGYLNWDEYARTINLDIRNKEYDDTEKSYPDTEKKTLTFSSLEQVGYTDLYSGIYQIRFKSCEYTGTVKDGKKDGIGEETILYELVSPDAQTAEESTPTISYAVSCTYKGEWKDGKKNGYGTTKYFIAYPAPYGINIEYIGKYVDNELTGKAQEIHSQSHYNVRYSIQGTYQNGAFQGYGREVRSSGPFIYSDRYLYKSIVTFDGEYKDGKQRNGYGRAYSTEDGSLLYEGEWENDADLVIAP